MGNQGGDNNGGSQGTQDQGKVAGIHELEKNILDSNEQKMIDKMMENFDKGLTTDISSLRDTIERGDINKTGVKTNPEESNKIAPLQLNDEEYQIDASGINKNKQKNPNLGQKIMKSLTGGSLADARNMSQKRVLKKRGQKEVRELEHAIHSGASSSKIAREAGDVVKFLKFGQVKLLSKKLRQLMGRSVNRAKKVPQNNKNTIGFP